MDKLHSFSEHTMLNEKSTFKIWDKIYNYFASKYKKHTWEYLLHFLKKKKELPKGVEFYPYSGEVSEGKSFKTINESGSVETVDLHHADDQISMKKLMNYKKLL